MNTILDSPKKLLKSNHKRASSSKSSTASIRTHASQGSTNSNASCKSAHSDLVGVRELEPGAYSHQTSTSPANSSFSGSLETSAASTSTTTSSAQLTDLDVFGVRLPPTEKERAPPSPNAVALDGRTFKVPEPIDKQFYRDLTVLQDSELIRKYGLIEVGAAGGRRTTPEVHVTKFV